MMWIMDSNQDGRISRDEFIRGMGEFMEDRKNMNIDMT
jgi:hypothetical protein